MKIIIPGPDAMVGEDVVDEWERLVVPGQESCCVEAGWDCERMLDGSKQRRVKKILEQGGSLNTSPSSGNGSRSELCFFYANLGRPLLRILELSI